MTLPFPKKDPAPPAQKPLATLVVTLNADTGELRVNGNCLADPSLVIRMLIEAGHMVLNTPVPVLKPDEPLTH